MKLKEHGESSKYNWIRNKTKSLFRYISSRKFKILFFVLIFLFIFIFGYTFGLITSGFFGTLDKPSQKARDFLRSIGLQSGAKSFLTGVLEENVKIPYNYIVGQFSNPEKIYIDIKFEDYQKILYKRSQILNDKFVFFSEEDYVPATIRYKDKELKAKIRLKGDAPENLEGDKWSMRINIRGGESLMGMRAFSIQHPKIRGYINEVIFHETLRREDIVNLRYNFVDVVINGKNKGIFGLEEHFDTELIENNNRRDGVILKFYEEDWYKYLFQYGGKNIITRPSTPDEIATVFNIGSATVTLDPDYINSYLYSSDIGFYESHVDIFNTDKVLNDSIKNQQFNIAKNLIESWRLGELKTHEVFDIDVLARYFAIVSLTGAEHGADWTNIRFYYNPVTSKLEPVGFNGYAGVDNYKIIQKFFPECIEIEDRCGDANNYYNLLFKDPVFFEKFISELERVSQKEYLDTLFSDLNSDIQKKINTIHKDAPYYHFSEDIFYKNQEFIRKILEPDKNNLLAYYHGLNADKKNVVLTIGNTNHLPIEILSLTYDAFELKPVKEKIFLQPRPNTGSINYAEYEFALDKETNDVFPDRIKINYKIIGSEVLKQQTILPWPYKESSLLENDPIRQNTDLGNEEFLVFNKENRNIILKEGKLILRKSLLIPDGFTFVVNKGTTIDLINGAMILSYSQVRFLGSENEPIKIFSSDGTGQGIIIINAYEQSIIENSMFDNLAFPSMNGWELTGAVTFYNSPAIIRNTKFSNIRAEDNLNMIKSPFELRDSTFENSLSDCFDVDFSDGIVSDILCNKCMNDCLDFSGSKVSVENIEARNIGDKGISAGEKSIVKAKNIRVIDSNIGAASKDLSLLEIDNIEINNCNYGLVAYKKKSEFGPASIKVNNAQIEAEKSFFIEKGSELNLNDKIILGTEKDVYYALYPEG